MKKEKDFIVGKCGKETMDYTAGSTSWDEQNSTSMCLQFGGLHISLHHMPAGSRTGFGMTK